MSKAFIFDIDDTLYDYDSAHWKGYDALCEFAKEKFGLSSSDFRARYMTSLYTLCDHTRAACAANYNRLIRFQIFLEQLGQPIYLAPRMTRIYWEEVLDNAVPYDGAEECFSMIHKCGRRIGIGTDMTADLQFAKLDRLGLLPYIDFMVSSEEMGVEKPAAWFFASCVEKAGCPAGECVFIGDRVSRDIKGGLDAGMQTIWVCHEKQEMSEEDKKVIDNASVRIVGSIKEMNGILHDYLQ